MSTENEMPQARRRELIVERVDGELLAYDTATHQAHRLLPTAAALFELADGTRTASELGVAAGLTESDVRTALTELRSAGLLEGGIPRRHVLLKAVCAGTFVCSVLVPRAASAGSCLLSMQACQSNPSACCLGLLCTTIMIGPSTLTVCI